MAGLDLKKYKATQPRKPYSQAGGASRPISQKKAVSSWNKGKGLSDKTKESIYTELSVLLSAGVDIKSAFDLLAGQQAKTRAKKTLEDLREMVVGGLGISESMQKVGGFTAYEYHSVKIGEETGKLSVVLADLGTYFKRRIKQRRQLIQALSYPVIVLTAAVGAVAFMLTFIVPMFSDVFRRFGGELPYLTTLIIALSAILRSYFVLIAAVVAGASVLVWSMRNKIWFRKYSGKLLLTLPVAGPVIRGVQLARLCGSLALLASARVPLVQAIHLVRQMVQFYPIQHSLEQVEKDLMAGMSLHQSLSNFAVYDKRLITLLRVGEETGKLDNFFLRMASQYNEEVEHRSAVLGSALEPIIIIFLGVVVGLVLMAMYLPLFELGTGIQ